MKQRKNSIKALRRRRQAEKRAEAARRVEEEQRRAALRVELEAERARSRAAAAARQRLATEPTVPAGDPPPRLEVRLGEEADTPRAGFYGRTTSRPPRRDFSQPPTRSRRPPGKSLPGVALRRSAP